MGGEFYEREVNSLQNTVTNPQPSSSENISEEKKNEIKYSKHSAKALNRKTLDYSNDPKHFVKYGNKLVCKHKNPIVFALDVSNSMGDWPMVFFFNFFS